MNEIQTIEPQVTITLDRYKHLLLKETKLKHLTTAIEAWDQGQREWYQSVVDKLLTTDLGD